MNTKDLPVLLFGIGIVCIAYIIKKSGIEGFQAPMQPPMPPGMPPAAMPPAAMPPGMPAGPPAAMPPGMPPGMPQSPGAPGMPQPPGMPAGMPPGMPPGPPGMPQPPSPGVPGVPQPPMAMKPNQQQLMDLSTKVRQMASEQGAIASRLQEITQSFGNEGFQSYKNPYNSASPGDTQAMEFRLGKKALIDNVVRY